MKKYFDYFKVPFIIVGIVSLVCIVVYFTNKGAHLRTNTESDITANVFDYADILSDEMEASLDKVIAQKEEELHYDIAFVILNESLEGRYNASPEHWVMNYADDFADNHKMGYDRAHGDSVVFVDNLFREPSTGKVYSWLSTSGRAMDGMDQYDCESILDEGLIDLDDYSKPNDYYNAYKKVALLLKGDGAKRLLGVFKPAYILIGSLVIALIYILVNWTSKVGERTTVSTTYVENGRPNITHKADTFLRKSVTKRKIEKSSGGGSGGHTSSGGFSHGGGGHSR